MNLSLIESAVDQSGSVKRRTKRQPTQGRTKRRQNNKNTQMKKLDLCDNHLFFLEKKKKKRCREVILGEK
jgi:hypothetical protein